MQSFYKKHGFSDYLAKPIHGSLLEATLLRFLPSELIEQMAEKGEEQVFQLRASRRRRPVIITADGVCDIPNEWIADADVRLMPCYISTDEGRFRDTTEIDSDNLFIFQRTKTSGVTTSTGSIEEYEAFFGEALLEGETVIHFSVASSISQGYNIASKAAESFNNVYVVDSGLASSGLGLMVCEAARLVSESRPVDEIIELSKAYARRVQVSFLVPTAESIRQNRIIPSPIKAMVRIFGLEPVFRMQKGRLGISRFLAGYVQDPARTYIIHKTLRDRKSDNSQLIVVFSGCTVKEQDAIIAEAERVSRFREIIRQKVSATIASHCGLHSFGLIYTRKENPS